MSEHSELKPGLYWIKQGDGDDWEPAEWDDSPWVEGASGTWGLLGSDIRIYRPDDLARVLVGPRLEYPR